MPCKVFSGALVGIDARPVEIETDLTYGLRTFDIVGLPDKTIEESEKRIGIALKTSGFKPPYSFPAHVLVSLAPADLKKEGALYDLPIAVGFLLASEQLSWNPGRTLLVGELALDGGLRPIKGALAFAMLAQNLGLKEILVPAQNAAEASLALSETGNLNVVGARTLGEAISYLQGKCSVETMPPRPAPRDERTESDFSIAFIRGQYHAKRALVIAAAGSHNLLFQGPPGTGKTLLAKALSGLLPDLGWQESLEATRIWSAAGLLGHRDVITRAPFRDPHHTASEAALIGGGSPPRPGEITLAHRGVLFLDEFPEFHRDVLESLRQPLEDGEIALLRAKYRVNFPARFILVAAANPCPCGFYRDPERACACTPSSIQKYRRKLSGPLMDRVDMFVDVPQVKFDELATSPDSAAINEESEMKKQVARARALQSERLGEGRTNAWIGIADIQKHCPIDGQSQQLLRTCVDSGKLSARGYHRVLKVARTIADLAESLDISYEHVAEALSYRGDRGEQMT